MPAAPNSDTTVHGLDQYDIQPCNRTSWSAVPAGKHRARAEQLPADSQPAPQRTHPAPLA
jgi:hypothetical protein